MKQIKLAVPETFLYHPTSEYTDLHSSVFPTVRPSVAQNYDVFSQKLVRSPTLKFGIKLLSSRLYCVSLFIANKLHVYRIHTNSFT